MTAYVRLIDSSIRRLFTGSRTIWKMFLKHIVQFNVQPDRQDSLKETVEETRREKKEVFTVAQVLRGICSGLMGHYLMMWECVDFGLQLLH